MASEHPAADRVVAFVCAHGALRSRLAAALFNEVALQAGPRHRRGWSLKRSLAKLLADSWQARTPGGFLTQAHRAPLTPLPRQRRLSQSTAS